ncbi:CDKA2 [Hepatospora eriocheir]|uniref:CDKA2 n=1 Tax=Hepatospora eriocheir TaxID=1081669 RepID=A0A1X0QKN5_9MICR|nr:CDKA2 [Hepatospora eriocheir]
MIIRREKLIKKEYSPTLPLVTNDIRKYTFKDVIGSGTFGKVYKATHRYYNFAIKKFNYRKSALHVTTVREILNLMKMKNKSNRIISLVEVVITNDCVYAVFPLMSKTLDTIKFRNIKHVQMLFKQIVEGVRDIHRERIIHRDLKPSNILVDKHEKEIKIIDLGMSRNISGCMSGMVTTLIYRAPELLIDSTTGYKTYGFGVDVWSIGIIFITMLIGKPLFDKPTEIEQLTFLKVSVKEKFKETFNFIKDETIFDLLENMLKWDRLERFTIEEIAEHEFFKKEYSYEDFLPKHF